MSSEPELLRKLHGYGSRVAVRALDGEYEYEALLSASAQVAGALGEFGCERGDRVAFAIEPSAAYVITMLGAWRAATVAVPIGSALAGPEVEYLLDDAAPRVIVVDGANADRIAALVGDRTTAVVSVDDARATKSAALPRVHSTDAALMLYTSGTTGRPKGVVHTHESLSAQIRAMVDMWGWSERDSILCTLPLHHVHGIVNVIWTALWCGARCDVMPSFDAGEVWQRITTDDLTLFMAVPTIYLRLIQAYDKADHAQQVTWSNAASATAAHGVGLRGAPGSHARALAVDHPSHVAGALRHDRNRHGAVQPVVRPAAGPRRYRDARRRDTPRRR